MLVILGAACAKAERLDVQASAAPSASERSPLPSPDVSAPSMQATGPLDPHGPELAMLGIGGGPDNPSNSRGRLGSRFVRKTHFADVGRPTTSGRLLPELATRIVEKRSPELNGCYRERLAKEPTLVGDLSVTLTLDRKGGVSETSSRGTLTDAPLIACVTSTVFAKLSFPPSGDPPATVTYPLTFGLGTTVSGKSILGIAEDDVRAALVAAQCTDVTSRGPAYPSGPSVLTAKLAGRAVVVAFVLGSGTPLSDRTLSRLGEKCAVYHERDPFAVAVAIEDDSDKSKAAALLAKLVVDPS